MRDKKGRFITGVIPLKEEHKLNTFVNQEA